MESSRAEDGGPDPVEDTMRRYRATLALQRFGEVGADAIVQELLVAAKDRDAGTCVQLLAAITDLKPPLNSYAANRVAERLDPDGLTVRERLQLVLVAGCGRSELCRNVLLELLGDESTSVRTWAVQQIGIRTSLGSTWARRALEKRLDMESDERVLGEISAFLEGKRSRTSVEGRIDSEDTE
jgi:hypothetical protein